MSVNEKIIQNKIIIIFKGKINNAKIITKIIDLLDYRSADRRTFSLKGKCFRHITTTFITV